MRLPIFILSACLLMAAQCTPTNAPPKLSATPQHLPDGPLFIGVSVVDGETAWLSGTRSTVVRTTDGGTNWDVMQVAPEDSLQFRDVHAIDAQRAYILSIGEGTDSRIYKTIDGGESWALQFQNPWEGGFFDCLDFWDADHGLAFSDAVDGSFIIIRTKDGGANWERISPGALPPALPGEGAFASSGTCLVTHGDSTAWIGTGAGGEARLLRTDDRGETWRADTTPLPHGTSTSGFTSLTILPDGRAAAAGSELMKPDSVYQNVAISEDRGNSWTLIGHPTYSGSIYGLSYVQAAPTPTLVAAGPGGLDVSYDGGASWSALDTLNYWTVGFDDAGTGWAGGTDGKILKLRLEP